MTFFRFRPQSVRFHVWTLGLKVRGDTRYSVKRRSCTVSPANVHVHIHPENHVEYILHTATLYSACSLFLSSCRLVLCSYFRRWDQQICGLNGEEFKFSLLLCSVTSLMWKSGHLDAGAENRAGSVGWPVSLWAPPFHHGWLTLVSLCPHIMANTHTHTHTHTSEVLIFVGNLTDISCSQRL